MLKLSLVSVAVMAALSTNAFAQSDPNFELLMDPPTSTVDMAAIAVAHPTTSATLIKSAATSSEARARGVQAWLNQANAPYANQLSKGNGTGVTIGMVDSGVQVDHPELKGQIAATYNVFTGGTDVTDQLGHGTHVAGLLAGSLLNGSQTQGVAPGAKLAVSKAFTTGGSDSSAIANGIDWAVNVQKTPILSLSLGAASVSLQSNIQNAVTKGTLVVAALGNDGKTNAASWPAEFAKATWANGQIIAVGAVDANNKCASFSNYDSTLSKWTVYAPGVNVASSYSNASMQNGYAYMSGTSMATPIVAGQAALIKSNWNFLTATDIANVIFQSATHLCPDAVSTAVCLARTTPDNMYGWGMVNIGASLQPIGGLNLNTKTGAVISYAGTMLSTPKTGLASGLSGVNAVGVDKFNRGFNINLSAAVLAAAQRISIAPASVPTTTTFAGKKFSAEYATQATTQNALGMVSGEQGAVTLAKMSFVSTDEAGTSFGFGTGGSEGNFLGLDSTGMTPLNLTGDGSRFNTPYFGLAENASFAGYAVKFGGDAVVRLGAVTQSSNVSSAMLGAGAPASGKTFATMDVQSTFGDTTLVATVGQLQESNSLVGLTGAGALAIGGNANTRFLTLAGAKPLGAKTVLSAMLSFGRTDAYSNDGTASLIDGATASTSAAWSFGLAQKDVFRNGDRLGVTLAMPLRTMTGGLKLTMATSQSQEDGSLGYSTRMLGLAPTGMERDIEVSYASKLTGGAMLTAVAQLKYQPGHVEGAAVQSGLGLRYVKPL